MEQYLLSVVEDGGDVNKTLELPYHLVVSLLSKKNKPKQTKSLIAAFTGG